MAISMQAFSTVIEFFVRVKVLFRTIVACWKVVSLWWKIEGELAAINLLRVI
jgi:hypothetical protein